MQHGEGLTGTERVVGPPELFTRNKVLALGRDALEVIRVVLEAVRGVMCARSIPPWVVRTNAWIGSFGGTGL